MIAHARVHQEIIQPFLIACETKNSKLAVTSLGCMQKLLANDAVALERVHGVVASLQHVERMGDEVIKLKVLQTALTLLQSNLRVTDEAIVGGTLGACFRILARSRNTDSVLSTAGATVRQGVTVVFQRLDEECGMQAEDGASPGCDTLAAEKLLKDICSLAHGLSHETQSSTPANRQLPAVSCKELGAGDDGRVPS